MLTVPSTDAVELAVLDRDTTRDAGALLIARVDGMVYNFVEGRRSESS